MLHFWGGSALRVWRYIMYLRIKNIHNAFCLNYALALERLKSLAFITSLRL